MTSKIFLAAADKAIDRPGGDRDNDRMIAKTILAEGYAARITGGAAARAHHHGWHWWMHASAAANWHDW